MSRSTGRLLLGVVAFGVLAYLYSRKSAAAQSVAVVAPGAPSLSPGSQAVTTQQAAQTGSFWSTLQAVIGPGEGYVNFPTSGGSTSQAAAAFLPFAMDASGNYYTQWAGRVFLIGAQDLTGNWPATLVNA